MDGTFSDLGSYDECLDVVAPYKDKNGVIVNGKYCLLELNLNLPERPTKLSMEMPVFNFTGTVHAGTVK